LKGKTRKNRFHLGQAYRAGFSEIENKEAREDKYQTKIWKKKFSFLTTSMTVVATYMAN